MLGTAGIFPITVLVRAALLLAGFTGAHGLIFTCICFIRTFTADLEFFVGMCRIVIRYIIVLAGGIAGRTGIAVIVGNTEIEIGDQALSDVNTVFSWAAGPGVAFQSVEVFSFCIVNDAYMTVIFFEK